MDLKQTIKRILREETQDPAKEKMIKLIEKIGLYTMIKTMGIKVISKVMKMKPIDFIGQYFTDIDYHLERGVDDLTNQDAQYTQKKMICTYQNEDVFAGVVINNAIETMYWDYFADIDDNSKEWNYLYGTMEAYLMRKYKDKLKAHYQTQCKNK